MEVNQYEIYWTDLDPTRGSEIQKTRPCLVISPNEMNHNINSNYCPFDINLKGISV